MRKEIPALVKVFPKLYVLFDKSSSTVTAAAGVMAYGVVGMVGVGKAVALRGLSSDEGIRHRFSDDILFIK